MCWRTSFASRYLRCLAVLPALLGPNALAQVQPQIAVREPVHCAANAIVPTTLPSDGTSELLATLSMVCSGGPSTGPGTSNVGILLDTGIANNATTGMPLLTISFDECAHVGQPILCPPDVPPFSNSLYFDPSGNVVFAGTSQPFVTVNPSNIFPYTPPTQFFGTVNGNSAMWSNVPVEPKAKGRRTKRFSNIQVNVSALPGANTNANLPLFGTFTSSSSDLEFAFPTSLAPGTNKFLMGVVSPRSTSMFCQSPLVITPGVTPFAVLRQVAVGAGWYDSVVTLSGPSAGMLTTLDLYAYSTSTTGSCQGSSVFNPATGFADLQNVFYLGQDFWAQANQSGSSFAIQRYGMGTMPPR